MGSLSIYFFGFTLFARASLPFRGFLHEGALVLAQDSVELLAERRHHRRAALFAGR